jgi:hypothetical protein
MKLVFLLISFLACTFATENPMLRALAKPAAKKVKVCACTGSETALKCSNKNLDAAKADALVAAGSAVLGKCEKVKFEICKCNKDGKCHTIKVAAPALPAQVKQLSNTLGACAPPSSAPVTAAPTSAPTSAPTTASPVPAA